MRGEKKEMGIILENLANIQSGRHWLLKMGRFYWLGEFWWRVSWEKSHFTQKQPRVPNDGKRYEGEK